MAEDRAGHGVENSKWVNFISDVFGLSSFLTQHASHRLYRVVILVAIVATHFTMLRTIPESSSDIAIIFFRIRLWVIFVGSVLIFFVQIFYGEAVKNCHSRLPMSSPSPRLLFRFFTCFTHFSVYYFFYIPLFILNLFYVLILMFYLELPSVQFEYLIEGVRRRMRVMNRNLKKFVNEGVRKPFSVCETRGKEIEIMRAHKEYLQLVELVDYLSNTYSYQILTAIAVLSTEILFILQSSFFDIIHKRNKIGLILDFSLKMYSFLMIFCNMLLVVRSGQMYSDECKKTDSILCQIINTNPGAQSTATEFAMQKMTHPASISILKLFDLNYGFLYNIGSGLIDFGFIVVIFYLGVVLNERES